MANALGAADTKEIIKNLLGQPDITHLDGNAYRIRGTQERGLGTVYNLSAEGVAELKDEGLAIRELPPRSQNPAPQTKPEPEPALNPSQTREIISNLLGDPQVTHLEGDSYRIRGTQERGLGSVYHLNPESVADLKQQNIPIREANTTANLPDGTVLGWRAPSTEIPASPATTDIEAGVKKALDVRRLEAVVMNKGEKPYEALAIARYNTQLDVLFGDKSTITISKDIETSRGNIPTGEYSREDFTVLGLANEKANGMFKGNVTDKFANRVLESVREHIPVVQPRTAIETAATHPATYADNTAYPSTATPPATAVAPSPAPVIGAPVVTASAPAPEVKVAAAETPALATPAPATPATASPVAEPATEQAAPQPKNRYGAVGELPKGWEPPSGKDANETVTNLQRALANADPKFAEMLKEGLSGDGVDGKFGARTQKALNTFAKENNIDIEGKSLEEITASVTQKIQELAQKKQGPAEATDKPAPTTEPGAVALPTAPPASPGISADIPGSPAYVEQQAAAQAAKLAEPTTAAPAPEPITRREIDTVMDMAKDKDVKQNAEAAGLVEGMLKVNGLESIDDGKISKKERNDLESFLQKSGTKDQLEAIRGAFAQAGVEGGKTVEKHGAPTSSPNVTAREGDLVRI